MSAALISPLHHLRFTLHNILFHGSRTVNLGLSRAQTLYANSSLSFDYLLRVLAILSWFLLLIIDQ